MSPVLWSLRCQGRVTIHPSTSPSWRVKHIEQRLDSFAVEPQLSTAPLKDVPSERVEIYLTSPASCIGAFPIQASSLIPPTPQLISLSSLTPTASWASLSTQVATLGLGSLILLFSTQGQFSSLGILADSVSVSVGSSHPGLHRSGRPPGRRTALCRRSLSNSSLRAASLELTVGGEGYKWPSMAMRRRARQGGVNVWQPTSRRCDKKPSDETQCWQSTLDRRQEVRHTQPAGRSTWTGTGQWTSIFCCSQGLRASC